MDSLLILFKKSSTKKKILICAIAAFVLLISIARLGSGGTETEKSHFDEEQWSTLVLGEYLPEPNTKITEIRTNTDEKLVLIFDDTGEEFFNEYVNACTEKGYKLNAEKSESVYKASDSENYKINMTLIESKMTVSLEAPMKFSAFSWPTDEVPAPKSTNGNVKYNDETGFLVYVNGTSAADYGSYVKTCSGAGFSKNAEKSNKSYSAENGSGEAILIKNEGNNIMSIKLTIPEKPAEATTEEAETTEADTTEKATEEEVMVDGMRKSFKDSVDSYEAFINQYVEFMSSYDEDSSDLEIIAEYTELLIKFAEMDDDFTELEEESMNEAESAYYTEVQIRTADKIIGYVFSD